MQFEKTATAEHPATLTATLTNANDFENTFRLDWTPPFGRLTSREPSDFGAERFSSDYTYRVGLVLAPTENHDLVEESAAFSRGGDGQWRIDGVRQWLPETVRLKPGETVRGEYAVVGRSTGAGKGRPPGVYEFSRPGDRNLRITVWETDAPGPRNESRFAGTSLPSLPGDASVAWYHESDATTPTYVEPSVEHGRLPEQVDFTFVNKSRKTTGCGHWDLYKLVDGQWFRIGPWAQTADCRQVSPGGTKRWTLNAYPGEALPPLEYASGGIYGHLGAGRYAAVAGYGHATDRSAALVELAGDHVTVVPTEGVSTARSGDTVTVTSPKYDDGKRPPSATLTVTRANDADWTLIPEQVMRRRFRALRNALAFFELGVSTVVVQTDKYVAERVVGYDSDTTAFRFDGQAYAAHIRRQE